MESNPDLLKQLKRLSIIKGLILLEEFDEASAHIEKLNGLRGEEAVIEIIADINLKCYADAVRKIDEFVNRNQTLTIYEDPEFEALKIEIKKLETEISNTSNDIIETEKLIHDFGLRHSRELGEIVSKILKHRKERLEQEQNENSAKKAEFEEAKKDYEQYQSQFEESKKEKQFELTAEESQELKKKYRRASLLCHPDKVTDEQREHAEIIFKELNAAYQKNDLKKVSEILAMLEKGLMFIAKSDSINEKLKLKVESNKLRKKLNDLKTELTALKESETYKTIAAIEDWDEYFKETKEKLEQELQTLANL